MSSKSWTSSNDELKLGLSIHPFGLEDCKFLQESQRTHLSTLFVSSKTIIWKEARLFSPRFLSHHIYLSRTLIFTFCPSLHIGKSGGGTSFQAALGFSVPPLSPATSFYSANMWTCLRKVEGGAATQNVSVACGKSHS